MSRSAALNIPTELQLPGSAPASPSGQRTWSTGHIRVLDGLRGCAVLAVMLYHFTAPEMTYRAGGFAGRIQRVAGAGWCGVDLFFVLSGFLITGILLDAKGSTTYFKSFYVRRVLRIFPLYYGVIALVALALASPSISQFFGFEDIKASLGWMCLFLGNFVMALRHDKTAFGPMGHFWSLCVEEHFYMVWPAVVLLCTRRQLTLACIGFMFGAFAMRCGVALHLGSTRGMDLTYMLTPCRVDGLAMGAVLASAVRGNLAVARVRNWAWIAGGLSLALILALGFRRTGGGFSHYGRAMNTGGFTLFAIFFTCVIALLISAYPGSMGRRAMEWTPLRSLGRYSFAMYVFHLILMRPFTLIYPFDRLTRVLGSQNLPILVFAVLSITCTYGLAWLSWHLYERNFLQLKRFFPY
ncbi:MAG TPA: acyltransferase [Tepidisphaeraceae bacterium]|nr:acyltransferase [Tepidisphaeraceae bacterium]